MGYFQVAEADGITVKRIDEAYWKMQESSECSSLLKKHFTQSVKDKLKYKKTKLGGSLLDVIRSGLNAKKCSKDIRLFKVFKISIPVLEFMLLM